MLKVSANAPPPKRCPDGGYCTYRQRCCPMEPPGPHRRYGCCDWGDSSVCCDDYRTCCPTNHPICIPETRQCERLRVNSYSSVLRVPALPLVSDTDKGCRDGKAGMDLKVGRIRPSQQPETALKKIRFIGTSGEVFFPDEKYQCPEGTSICELSSGIYGCCHLVRGYVKLWQKS